MTCSIISGTSKIQTLRNEINRVADSELAGLVVFCSVTVVIDDLQENLSLGHTFKKALRNPVTILLIP